MRRLRMALGLALAALVWACDQAPFVKAPPSRYRVNATFAVETHNTEDLPAICAGGSSVGEGQGTVVACVKNGVIHMPNPTQWPDPYAQVLSHEMAHALGWPASHPDQ